MAFTHLEAANPDLDAVAVAAFELREQPEQVVPVRAPDVVLADDHAESRATG